MIKNIYTLFSSSDIPIASDDKEIMDLVDPSSPLPPWFSNEDLAAYADLYKNSEFRTALQVPYRCINKDCGIKKTKITAPSLLIMGEKDYGMKIPGMEEYVRSEKAKEFMPDLEIDYIPEGSHFVQEQFPEKVNELIISFLGKHGA